MHDIIGSVRRSLVFRGGGGDGEDGRRFGGLVEKVGSSIRKSRIGIFPKQSSPGLPLIQKNECPPIRWRKGELIGCGAFGRVFMGMNLDSGELLAVKQVSIAGHSASKEKTQAHIRELEEEVMLLKNLSHPNIVRYLGTAREEESLNILLEFVPGGSISSLLGKFGSFPEAVIRMYTKQLLLGLEYLHKNGIMHRDIKGANILVDNKGCIKLADFGASKKVVELATMTGAKSMKGTPYWMAPEVILQTGHSFSADIWSVGCTIIEMATGKPPWSQQFQEVAALFHIGTTKSHPPIPEHLSSEANDLLLRCLQKEPRLRPSASDLLQHPFVAAEHLEHQSVSPAYQSVLPASIVENSRCPSPLNLMSPVNVTRTNCTSLNDACDVRCSTVYSEKSSEMKSQWRTGSCEDDMCEIDDKDDSVTGVSVKFRSALLSRGFNKSFNPMSEPADDWPCNFEKNEEVERNVKHLFPSQTDYCVECPQASGKVENNSAFPSKTLTIDDDDEATESKIRAFLDEKALDLKKLQTPLYEEFYNSISAACHPHFGGEKISPISKLTSKSRSPKRIPSRRFSAIVVDAKTPSPGKHSESSQPMSNEASDETQSSQPSEWKECCVDSWQESVGPSASFSERQRKWKEELDEELERKRAVMRQAGAVGKMSSPKGFFINRQRDQFRLPGR